MRSTSNIILALAIGLLLGSNAHAANDSDTAAPSIGSSQITAKPKKKRQKQPEVKLGKPALDLGIKAQTQSTRSKPSFGLDLPAVKPADSGHGPRVQPPRPIKMAAPAYPDSADGASATVKIAFTVLKNGAPGNIQVVTQDLPAVFVKTSREAVKNWRFRPKTVDGRPRRQRVTQTIHFAPPPGFHAAKSESAPASPATGDGPSVGGGAPVPVHIKPPQYPRKALRQQVRGYVVVAFTVNADGSTSDIKVVSAQPRRIFNRQAIKAVRQWRFKPYRIDGKPASTRVRQRIGFAP